MLGTRLAIPGRIAGWQAVVVVAFAVGLYALALSSVAFGFDGRPTYQLDFDVYREAASAWASGQPLYEHPFRVSGTPVGMPFTYPPLAAIVLVPATWLGYRQASLVWMALTSVALVLCLYVVARSLAYSRWLSIVVAVLSGAAAVWLIPVRANLAIGQINVLLMALVVADVLVQNPRWPRGLLIGVAAALKLTPAGFALYFLLRRDYRAAAIAAATGIGLTALVALVSPQNSKDFWWGLGSQSDRVQVFKGVANLSIRGLTERLPVPSLAALVIWLALSALVAAAGVVAMRRQLKAGEDGMALMVNAVVVLLVSPVSWDHHWVWVAPLLLLLAPSVLKGSAMALTAAAGTAVIFLVDQVGYNPLRGGWVLWLAWGVAVVCWLSRRTVAAARYGRPVPERPS